MSSEDNNASKVALITGANKGIGLETARQLGAEGISVLVGARDPRRGGEAVDTLTAAGFNAALVTIDVTDHDSIGAAVAQIDRDYGRLDILVNNAGGGFARLLPSEMDVTVLREVLETNLYGAIATAQACLPLIRKSPAGRIVNVSSSLGSVFHLSDPQWVGRETFCTPYSISKSALNSFTALLAAELGDTPIKVNAVEPGFTITDLTGQQGFQGPDEAAKVVVKYALIGPEGPSGGYFDIQGRLPW